MARKVSEPEVVTEEEKAIQEEAVVVGEAERKAEEILKKAMEKAAAVEAEAKRKLEEANERVMKINTSESIYQVGDIIKETEGMTLRQRFERLFPDDEYVAVMIPMNPDDRNELVLSLSINGVDMPMKRGETYSVPRTLIPDIMRGVKPVDEDKYIIKNGVITEAKI